jgi:hypothetical protein
MTMPHHGKHVSGGRYVLLLLALFTMGNVADWWVEPFAPVTMAFQKHSTSTTGNNPTNKLHLEVTKSSTEDQDTATNSRRREIKIKTTSHHHDKENKETSPPPSLLIDANSIIAQTGGRNFPHSMIVDQELIKKALLLAAVNERVGGVVIWGGRGTGTCIYSSSFYYNGLLSSDCSIASFQRSRRRQVGDGAGNARHFASHQSHQE